MVFVMELPMIAFEFLIECADRSLPGVPSSVPMLFLCTCSGDCLLVAGFVVCGAKGCN